MSDEWTYITDELKRQLLKMVLRTAKEFLDERISKKIIPRLKQRKEEITDYISLVKILEEELPPSKFSDMRRELSKRNSEFAEAYRRYMKETMTEEQEEWFKTYGLTENPFDFVSGIRDWKLFVGYEKEREVVTDRILLRKGKGGVINVHGIPLIGKTSFLIYMDEILSGEGIIVSTVSRPSTSSTDFLKNILDEIIEKDKRATRTTQQKLKRILAGNQISETSRLLEAKKPWASTLFSKLKEICEDNHDKRFMIIVDESQDMKGETLKYFLKCLKIENVDILMSQREKNHPDDEVDAKTGIRVELRGITRNDTLELVRRYLSSCRSKEWDNGDFEPFEQEIPDLVFKYSLISGMAATANPGSVVKLCNEAINQASLKGSLVNEEVMNSSAKTLGLSIKKESVQENLDSRL